MKKQRLIVMATALIAFVLGLLARGAFGTGTAVERADSISDRSSQEAAFYSCSMHPQIRQPNPGK